MKDIKVDNSFYTIGIDSDINRIYLVLKESFTDLETDKNLVTNFLSHSFRMEDRFNLVLDLRLYDPRIKEGLFFKKMDQVATRLSELNCGPQVHIMNDILWSLFGQKYGIENPEPPAITDDANTGEKIARFNTLEDGDAWLDINGYPSEL